jgi:hypothetical protein
MGGNRMSEIENVSPAVRTDGADTRAPQMGDNAEQRVFLPQAASQSRFAPPQYFYPASRSGAVPSWAVAGVPMGAGAAPRRYQPAQ